MQKNTKKLRRATHTDSYQNVCITSTVNIGIKASILTKEQ